MRYIIVIAALLLAGLGGAGAQGMALAAGGGNSTSAHACQQGGYSSLMGSNGVTDVSSFSNAGACTSYAAHGGSLAGIQAASPCLNGGYANLTAVGGTSAFSSEAACVLYVAQGGTPVALRHPQITASQQYVPGTLGLGCIVVVIQGTGFAPDSQLSVTGSPVNVIPSSYCGSPNYVSLADGTFTMYAAPTAAVPCGTFNETITVTDAAGDKASTTTSYNGGACN